MHVLLTGAGGFLASYLLPILTRDHQVTAVVRRETAPLAGERQVVLDLAAPLSRGALPARVDAVMHLAQSPRYREFPEGGLDLFEVNVGSTARLLDYARCAGASHFVLASSGAVYEPFDGPLAEDRPVAPRSFYATTKVMAEGLLDAYRDSFRVCALRPFFPYGPGQRDRLVPEMIARIAGGEPVTLNGGSEGPRIALTAAADTTAIMARALDDGWQGVVNVASGEGITIRRLAELIGEELHRKVHFQGQPDAGVVDMIPDLERLRRLVPEWRFQPLTQGLRETVEAQAQR